MSSLKKILGVLWILTGIALITFMARLAVGQISSKPTTETYIQWLVFLFLSMPISAGLVLFGWFALKGEYNYLPTNSEELEKKEYDKKLRC